MARLYERMAATAKIEVTYGVDPVATGVLNAMLFTNVSITPLAGGVEDRGLLTPTLGNTGILPAGTHVRFEGDIEIAGSGTAGTAPAWGVLMRACGMGETITAGTNVVYKPSSANPPASLTLNYFADGMKHTLTGARGSWKTDLVFQKIPRLRFSFVGLYNAPSDAAVPAVTLTGWKRPVLLNKANTTVSLHGVAQPTEQISIDLGNTIEPRLLIGAETVELTNRNATGRIQLESGLIAGKDWFGTHLAGTRGTLAVQQGTVGGNIVKFDAPVVEIGAPEQSKTGTILTYGMPLYFIPSAGDDEIAVTVM